MPAIWKQKDSDKQASTLFVLLPGRRDRQENFLENGFVDSLWQSGIVADVVLPDAHLGYYYRRTFPERVREDIIIPARKMGYREIWAVGVSLGGFGSLMFERDHPGTWDGVVLIAPFTGDQQEVLDEIQQVSNLQNLTFQEDRTDDDYTANFWEWVQSYQRDPKFPVFLGYGLQGRMQVEQSILAGVLPSERVVAIPGNHKWEVWKKLWQELIPLLPIERKSPESEVIR